MKVTACKNIMSIQTLLFIANIGCRKIVVTPKAEIITMRKLLKLMTKNLPLKYSAQFPMDYLHDNAKTYPGLHIILVPTKTIQDSNIDAEKINHLFNTYTNPVSRFQFICQTSPQIIYLTDSFCNYNADAVVFIFDSIGTTVTGTFLYNWLQVDQNSCCWQRTDDTNIYLMPDQYNVINCAKWKTQSINICGEYGIDEYKGIIYKLKNKQWKMIWKIPHLKGYHTAIQILQDTKLLYILYTTKLMIIDITHEKLIDITHQVNIDYWNMGRIFQITIGNNRVLLIPNTNDKSNIIYTLNADKTKFIKYFTKPTLNNKPIRRYLMTSIIVQNCVYIIGMPQGVMFKWNIATKQMTKMNVPNITFNKMNCRFRHIKISNITYDLKYCIFHESYLNYEHLEFISNIYILDLHNNIVKLSSLPGPCSTGILDIVIEKMDTYEQELLLNGYIRNNCPFPLPIALIQIITINKLEEIVYFIDAKRSRYSTKIKQKKNRSRYLQTNIRHILHPCTYT